MTTASLPLLSEGKKKRWSYSSLLFSLFYFVAFAFEGIPHTSRLLIVVILYVVFVVLYLVTIHVRRQRLPVPLTALVITACLASLYNPGGAVIFGFIAFIVGYYYPAVCGLIFSAMTAVALIAMQSYWYDGSDVFFIAASVNTLVLFGFGYMERNETRQQLRDSAHAESLNRLSAIAERERIGRDLHDIAGHALSSLSLKAQLADKLLAKGRVDEAREEVQALASLSQSLLSEIRQAVSNIKHQSLANEIEKGCGALANLGFKVHNNIDERALSLLTPLQETHASLIVKESITNIIRHSNGTRVSISLSIAGHIIHIVISDDGQCQTPVRGNGMTGMYERANLIGAALTVTTGSSTVVQLEMPQQGATP